MYKRQDARARRRPCNRVETAESGAVIRGALRRDPLDGLRAQGRRLATLTKTSDAGLKYDDAIARVDALDRTLRRLEIDGSDRALAAAATAKGSINATRFVVIDAICLMMVV